MKYICSKNICADLIIYIALFIILQSCEKTSEEVLPSEIALNYLNDALDILENNSVKRKVIEWASFREEIIKIVGSAQVPKDTYQAIDHAVRSLNDNHSSFLTPEEVSFFETQRSDTIIPIIEAKHIENVGYIRIPGFSGDSLRSLKFATELQSAIEMLDNDSIQGWIVDLRGNTGGNMWPMLAGIGPILGEGLVGYFIDPDNNKIPWYYNNGAALIDDYPITKVNNHYSLLRSDPKVAILTDRFTASSGESIVVAFTGRTNTRSFGSSTAGLTTANSAFELSDGAIIVLAVSTVADRTGKLYGNKIDPDQNTTDSEILDLCIEWISN